MTGRRTLLLGAGIGAAAAVAGVATGLWRARVDGTAAPAEASAEAVVDDPPIVDRADRLQPAFWAMRFARPGGGELALDGFRGRLVLLNFWATWCPPCVRELPMLDRFARERAGDGWRVLGIAIDGPTPVREFLQRQPVGFPIGLAGLDGSRLARRLGNADGALPFSVVADASGQVRGRVRGELAVARLQRWADEAPDWGERPQR